MPSENEHYASERKHKRQHKEKEKFWSFAHQLVLALSRGEINALVLALIGNKEIYIFFLFNEFGDCEIK